MALTNENVSIIRASVLPETLVPNTIYLVPSAEGGLNITVVGKTADVHYTTSGVTDLEATIKAVVEGMELQIEPSQVVGLLDDDGVIKMSMLPNALDNLESVPTFADLDPATGKTSTLYVTEDTNTLYRWGPTVDNGNPGFVPIPGETGSALKLEFERTIALTGGATGEVKFDGSKDVELEVTINEVPGTAVNGPVAVADSLSAGFAVEVTGAVSGTGTLAADGKSILIETTIGGEEAPVEDGTYVKVTTSGGIVTAGETKLAEEDLPDTISGTRIEGPVASALALSVEAEW